MSETANEPPQDEGNSFNSPRNLAMEATYINHNFSQQCLRMVRRHMIQTSTPPLPLDMKVWITETLHVCLFNGILFSFVQGGERHKFPNPNPFVEEDMDKSEVASVAYRWDSEPCWLVYCHLSQF